MPIIHVNINEDNFKIYSSMPKQVRGKFVDAAISYFLKTAEGQAIIDFNRINGLVLPIPTSGQKQSATALNKQSVDGQYPDLDGWDS